MAKTFLLWLNAVNSSFSMLKGKNIEQYNRDSAYDLY
jgi:hypothetical protein